MLNVFRNIAETYKQYRTCGQVSLSFFLYDISLITPKASDTNFASPSVFLCSLLQVFSFVDFSVLLVELCDPWFT